MKSYAEITNVTNAMYEVALGKLDSEKEMCGELVKSLASGIGVEEGIQKCDALVGFIASAVRGLTYEEMSMPDFMVKVTTSDEDVLKSIDVKICNRLKAEKKFKYVMNIAVTEQLEEDIFTFVKDTVFGLFYVEAAEANLVEFNEILRGINAEHDIKKAVYFTADSSKRIVSEVSDDEITLVVSPERAFGVSDFKFITPVAEPEEGADRYDYMVYTESLERYVDSMKSIQITPQVLRAKIPVVMDMLSLPSRQRADSTIKKSGMKKIANVKTGVGYYEAEVDGRGTLSVLSKDKDGKLGYVLHPFFVDTLEACEADVL